MCVCVCACTCVRVYIYMYLCPPVYARFWLSVRTYRQLATLSYIHMYTCILKHVRHVWVQTLHAAIFWSATIATVHNVCMCGCEHTYTCMCILCTPVHGCVCVSNGHITYSYIHCAYTKANYQVCTSRNTMISFVSYSCCCTYLRDFP